MHSHTNPRNEAPHQRGVARSREPHGQGLAEYALILVLVGAVVLGTMSVLGARVSNVFSNVNNTMAQSIADAGQLQNGNPSDKPPEKPASTPDTNGGGPQPSDGSGEPSDPPPSPPTDDGHSSNPSPVDPTEIPDADSNPSGPSAPTNPPVVASATENSVAPTLTHTSVLPTATDTPTNTASLTSTNTNTPTATYTPSPTNTNTPTHTYTPSLTNTNTPTATYTPSPTNTDTPLPTPTDMPTATETPVITNYVDKFDGKGNMEWTPVYGTWSITNQTLGSTNPNGAIYSSIPFNDYTFEADIQTVTAGSQTANVTMMLFRVEGLSRYYAVTLRKNGYIVLSKSTAAGWVDSLESKSTWLFSPTSSNRIRVIVQGTKIDVYIVSSLLGAIQYISYEDKSDPIRSGGIGFANQSSTSRIDNVNVVKR